MEFIHDGDCLPFNATDIVVNCGGPGGKPGPCPSGDGESPLSKDDLEGREQIKALIMKHGPEKFNEEVNKLPPAAKVMIEKHVKSMAAEHLAKLNDSPKAQKALKELRKGSESKKDADKRVADAKKEKTSKRDKNGETKYQALKRLNKEKKSKA